MDKATPSIFIESCCGTGKTIKIAMTKTGSGQGADVFVEYTFENALFAQMITLHNGLRPIEEIEISYTRMTTKYIPYDENGSATAPLVIGFDATTNTKI
ncbi:MAG: type VI secretion system tube protein Hcp [Cellvibrionaceae bacterium]